MLSLSLNDMLTLSKTTLLCHSRTIFYEITWKGASFLNTLYFKEEICRHFFVLTSETIPGKLSKWNSFMGRHFIASITGSAPDSVAFLEQYRMSYLLYWNHPPRPLNFTELQTVKLGVWVHVNRQFLPKEFDTVIILRPTFALLSLHLDKCEFYKFST